MKPTFALVFFILGFASCNPKNSKKVDYEPTTTKEFTETERGNFYPSEKTTEKFDTIIQNEQIQVTIIKKDLDSFVVNEYENDGVKQIDKYRDAEITLRIKQKSQILLDTVFRKNQFLKYADKDFLDIAIFHSYWFEVLDKGNLKFMGVISKPETDWTFAFDHIFSFNGKTMKLVEHPDNEE